MKKKKLNWKTWQQHRLILALLLSLICGLIGYQVYAGIVSAAVDPVLVPVASCYLKSGTVITREDLMMIEVPRPVILEGVQRDPEQLIGMAVNTYNAVAPGSLFYLALLTPADQLHDVSVFPLNEGEVAVTIDADIKTSYANSILPGHRIDLFFQGYASGTETPQEKQVLYGRLVNQARVIAVRDGSGRNIDAQSEQATAAIVVALSYEEADLVQRAKFFGTVLPMVTYASLNPSDNGEDVYDAAKIRDILYQKTIDVSLVREEESHE